jgi:hypothetical protein
MHSPLLPLLYACLSIYPNRHPSKYILLLHSSSHALSIFLALLDSKLLILLATLHALQCISCERACTSGTDALELDHVLVQVKSDS